MENCISSHLQSRKDLGTHLLDVFQLEGMMGQRLCGINEHLFMLIILPLCFCGPFIDAAGQRFFTNHLPLGC